MSVRELRCLETRREMERLSRTVSGWRSARQAKDAGAGYPVQYEVQAQAIETEMIASLAYGTAGAGAGPS